MRLSRSLVSVFGGLMLVTGSFVGAQPVSAATAATGLSALVGQSGGHFAETMVVAPGATVNMLITYTNEHATVGQKFVTIKDVLPAGTTFKPTSAYLYNPAAPQGVQQPDTLTTGTGIATGPLKAGEKASIQFQMIMPGADKLNCGRNPLINQATAMSRSKNQTYAVNTRIVVKRDCTAAPTPAPTPTPTPTPNPTPTPPTSTTSTDPGVSIIAIDASTNTVNNTTNNYQTAAAPQVAGARTTAAQTKPAATKDDNAKTLVNTGPGSILMIALLATVVGAIGSRLVLYRLLGA